MECCCVCSKVFDFKEDGGAIEEGTDDYWCLDCIERWEKENGAYWASGQPKDKNGRRTD